MKKFFSKFKKSDDDDEIPEAEEEFLELNPDADSSRSNKVVVRPYIMNDFSDVKGVLDSLREGYTIALVNIKPLKDKDLVELKRAINKLKKTTEAIEGDIAGFGEDYLIVAPNFAQIYRGAGIASTRLPDE